MFSGVADDAPRRIEKRNRKPVSCEPCRSRKLKCNRGLPCDACVRRGLTASCHYAANATRAPPAGLVAKPKLRDFNERLDSLEEVVRSFQTLENQARDRLPLGVVAKGGVAQKTESVPTPESYRLQRSQEGHVSYVDPSNWQSLLEDIREVRQHLFPDSASPDHASPRQDAAGPFLRDSGPNVELDTVLSSLPQQHICDMLLSQYFGSQFMNLGFIHPTKFQEEYESFSSAPLNTPPLWVALLFSILGMAASLRAMSRPTASDHGAMPSPKVLQDAAMQCLVIGRYTTANEHALEAFLLHLQGSLLSGNSGPVDLWFEMGTIIRLAFRMGYHRDPRHLPGVSPFDGEMRRRVWLNIVQIDALMSFQIGLPSMIPSDSCDTQDPLNLVYTDLHPELTALPAARPLSEHTPVSYVIVKSRVMGQFKKIVSHTQLSAPAHETTLSLEGEMRRIYSDIPQQYRQRDINRSFTDSSTLILERCTIERLYLKGIIVLLRRFVGYDVDDSAYGSLRRGCVEAALNILTQQADVSQACRPGGRLFDDRWMFLSQLPHDYLLAAMVICLDLSVHMRSDDTRAAEASRQQHVFDSEYRALLTARDIWSLHRVNSEEMRMGAETINLMIEKVDEKERIYSAMQKASSMGTVVDEPDDFALPYADTMAQMIDGSETIDWNLLDQYFQGRDGLNTDFTL